MADPDTQTPNHQTPNIFIFTYGTLKTDFPNYTLIHDLIRLNDATFVGTYITHQSYPLVIGPHGIPFLINLPNVAGAHHVKGEVYSVSTRGLRRLDELEGTSTGHYERLPIQVQAEIGGEEMITAEAYYAHRSFGERMWEKRGKAGLSEYSERHGNEYVKKEDRIGGSFIDAIESFLSIS
ncbi:putative gamma-glutamylcyclotransferase At3g02910 [Euphorbia lathyris]|uniref:putative gamma-glutamylcyclotransferase At3g02910 n=1 Tax=Euphorbia lathyris TaxID=212925 RepID=UPI00331398F8